MNDFCDVALAVEADGVHLGQDDLPLAEARNILGKNRLIGISTHSIEQAREAEKGRADYIGFGPMCHTQTKDTGLKPLGPNAAQDLREQIEIPIFGIGGIKLENIAELRPTGMNGTAILSAVLQAPNIEVAVREFVAAWPNHDDFAPNYGA
jgi:thiamine-phosphate pyrophosphorylase